MDTLIIGGGLSPNIYPQIGAILALPNTFKDYIGFGKSSILALYLAINFSLGDIIELFVFIEKISSGDLGVFIREIKQLIEFRLGNMTFEEFSKEYRIGLHFGTYNLSRKCEMMLNVESVPDMKISNAIELCITVPGKSSTLTYHNDIFVDVSFVNSIPLSIISSKLQSKSIIIYFDSSNLTDKTRDLLKILSIIDSERKEIRIFHPSRIIRVNSTSKDFAEIIALSYIQTKNFIKSISSTI